MSYESEQLTPELLERVRLVGEAFRAADEAAQRQAGPVVAQALLLWEEEDGYDETTTAR